MMESKKHIFTPHEKRTFLEILKNYSRIVENKNTQSSALKAKNLAWQKITSEFNSSPHACLHRTPKQLRRLWMNLKHRQKELIASRYHRLPAGRSVEDVAPHVLHAIMTGMDNSMDSDIVIESVVTEDPVQSEMSVTSLFLNENSQNVSNQETPSFSTVKIEPLSPGPTYTAEAAPTPLQPPPPLQNNKAHSSQHHKENSIHIENSTTLRTLEIHDLEKELLRERIRGLYKEHKSREAQATTLHNMEIQLLKEKVREAKAKADLAELQLRRQQNL